MITEALDPKYTNIVVMKYGGLTVEFARQNAGANHGQGAAGLLQILSLSFGWL